MESNSVLLSLFEKLKTLNITISVVNEELKIKAPKGVLTTNLVEELKLHKEELLKFCKKKNIYKVINSVEKKEYYPLSSSQKRLFILQKLDLNSKAYNMPYFIPINNDISKESIEEIFKKLIARHESLRTSFHLINDLPVQRIHSNIEFEINEYITDELNIIKEYIQPFNLGQTPLIRVTLLRSLNANTVLLIDMHHIITDGTSHSILEQDFFRLFSGESLLPLRIQYKDFSVWQESQDQKIKIKEKETFWLSQFSGELPVLELPMDFTRPTIQSVQGAIFQFALTKDETNEIRKFTMDNELTLFMSILMIYSILLLKLTGQEDIIIGVPIAGRRHNNLVNIVGLFINTIAIRCKINRNQTIKNIAESIRQQSLNAFENQDYPFEELVEKVAIDRDLSRNPLFSVMFNLLNHREYSGDLSSFVNDKSLHTPSISKFDLTLSATDYGDQLLLSFDYCTELFRPETIERFAGYFKQILNQLCVSYDDLISEVDIIPEIEKYQLLYEFNNTRKEYPKEKTIHQLFEEQVERLSDRIALVFENNEMTYRELNERANRLAKELLGNGVKPGSIVGLMVERSLEMIVGIIGILKVGGLYMPVDPTYPKERKLFMLNDSQAGILVTSDLFYEDFGYEGRVLSIESCIKNSNDASNLSISSSSENLAYTIYTSGSTGRPKGVLIRHYSVINTICWYANRYKIKENIKVMLASNYTFDASVNQIFGTLTFGGTLCILPNNILADSQEISYFIEKNCINIMNFVPSLIQDIVYNKKKIKSLNIIISGGEVLTNNLKDIIVSKGYELHNHYGPTEATIVAIAEKCSSSIVTIGVPRSNTSIYIIDANNNIQPIGLSGELCIGGDGLALGYLNNPELTSDKFIDHPFQKDEKLYRSGDLARWLPNGSVEFLGRVDHQVKIRGFRIELGEIENALLKHKSIREAVVIAREDNGEKFLCAYLVCDEKIDRDELRTYLLTSLPEYMLPTCYMELEKLPLNSNGKMDRKSLPTPEYKAGSDYIAPSNVIESKLVNIWSEVLSIPGEEISVTANFFAIGGHSLRASACISKMSKIFRTSIPLIEIFKKPTISQLAKTISIDREECLDNNITLLKEGRRDVGNLFLIHDGSGDVDGYIELCQHADDEMNYWGIKASGFKRLETYNITIEQIAQEYMKSIQRVQASGEYRIMGWSLGGAIALEIARLLEQSSNRVSFLGIIDSIPPRGLGYNHQPEFTVESELEWLKQVINNTEILGDFDGINDLDNLWSNAIDSLKHLAISEEVIKRGVMALIGYQIKDYERLPIEELIVYMNFTRTLLRACMNYAPEHPVHAEITYFKAKELGAENPEFWFNYSANKGTIYEIEGDHFTILKQPGVFNLYKEIKKFFSDTKERTYVIDTLS